MVESGGPCLGNGLRNQSLQKGEFLYQNRDREQLIKTKPFGLQNAEKRAFTHEWQFSVSPLQVVH